MGDPNRTTVVAAVQASAVYLDREKTVAKACALIREAGRKGARIIAFSEGFVPGHPNWFLYYPCTAPECEKYSIELFKNAVEVPSHATDELGKAAAEVGAYVVIGISERVPGTTGTLYNSQLFIGPDGQILGCHRKIVPTQYERLVYGNGDGSTLGVVPTPFGPLGGLMCGENTNSLERFYLLACGEKVHVAAWPAFYSEWEYYFKEGLDLRTRNHAFEGKNYVINACEVFTPESASRVYPEEVVKKVRFVGTGGHSSIIGPKGQFLAGPLDDAEGILYAEIDYDGMIEAKLAHDVLGHYNRFDIFRLMVNRERLGPLSGVDPANMWLEGVPQPSRQRLPGESKEGTGSTITDCVEARSGPTYPAQG